MKPIRIAVVALLLSIAGLYAQTGGEDSVVDVVTLSEAPEDPVTEQKQDPSSEESLSVSDKPPDNPAGSNDLLYTALAGEDLPVDVNTLPEIPGGRPR